MGDFRIKFTSHLLRKESTMMQNEYSYIYDGDEIIIEVATDDTEPA